MSGPGQGGRGGGWSPLHFRPPSPYAPSPPPRFGSPGMPMFATRHPHMAAPRPRWPSPLPPGMSPPPVPPSPRPFRMPMHPPSPAPTRCATPDFFRGISPYGHHDAGPPPREYEFVGVPLEPPPLPKNYEPDEEESGPSTAEIIANQSQDYVDEKLAEYQATILLLQVMILIRNHLHFIWFTQRSRWQPPFNLQIDPFKHLPAMHCSPTDDTFQPSKIRKLQISHSTQQTEQISTSTC